VEVTEGWLLDGRVRHDQLRTGHRTGIEPVLLAASVAAVPGQRVLEGGTGTGAALLCLATRVNGISGVGIERDAILASLARRNIAATGLTGLEILTGDVAEVRPHGWFDHAFANPPWHDAAGTASPDPVRESARRSAPGLWGIWVARLAASLRHHGTLTLIAPAPALPAALAGLSSAGCGSAVILPLWPKPHREAKLLFLRGIKGGRGPCRLLPGLTLHAPDGSFTAEATAILRAGAPLSWAGAGSA
jgi:tRNA1(Val) A37 N6-methylase TrmN6